VDELGFLDWFYKDPEGFVSEVIYIPKDMNHAAEAVAYINQVDKEEVILTALDEYLRKNLWSTKETEGSIKIKRMKQLRK
jgi:hypothetical protein